MADYSFIQGFGGKGMLLYLRHEKTLFVKKVTRDDYAYYECYHNMQKYKGFKSCSASCSIIRGEFRRNQEEHCHQENHKIKYKDLLSINAMKETCYWLREHCPPSAHKIPLYDIYMLEMSK